MAGKQQRRRAWMACLLLFGATIGCSQPEPGQDSRLPAIPEIQTDSFVPEFRDRVRQSYGALRQTPEDAGANGAMGMLLHAHQKFELAETFYGRARGLKPGEMRWQYYLGISRVQLGKYVEAVDDFRQALKLDAGFLPARLRLAEALLKSNQIEESKELYESLVALEPSNEEAQLGLGRVRLIEERPADAIEGFRKAIELNPRYGQAHYELALAYRDAANAELSRKHLALYQADQQTGPSSRDPLMDEVRALRSGATEFLKRGAELEAAGDIEGAIAEHLRAIEDDPQFEQAHVNLVALYGRIGNAAKAEEHYRAALALNPNHAELHYNYGVLLVGQKRLGEAEKAFRRALASNPRYARAHTNLGQMLEVRGRYDEALEHYQSAVESQPNYRLARFHLGRMRLAKNEPDQAIAQFEQIVEPEDANTPEVLMGLAAAYSRKKERQKALRYAEAARDMAQARGAGEMAARIQKDIEKLR